MSNLLCTGTICMNTTKILFLCIMTLYEKLPPYLVMHLSGHLFHDLFYSDGSAPGRRVQRHFYDVQMRKSRRNLYLWLGSFPHPNRIIYWPDLCVKLSVARYFLTLILCDKHSFPFIKDLSSRILTFNSLGSVCLRKKQLANKQQDCL